MEKRVRQIDIAKALGVTKATVSMALRGNPRISPETRRKVEEMAQEMGFVPDPALRRLADARWQNRDVEPSFALTVLAQSREDYPRQTKAVLAALDSEFSQLGYSLTCFYVEDYPRVDALVRVLRARGVQGVIVLASQNPDAYQGFPWHSFSAIQMLTGKEQTQLPVVRYDAFGTMLSAGLRVLEEGHKRAVIILTEQETFSVTDWRDRAAAHLVIELWKKAGMTCRFATLPRDGKQVFFEDAFAALEAVKPEALVVFNEGVLPQLIEPGTKVPEELRIISLNVHNSKSQCAGYRKDFRGIAKTAILELDAYVRHGRRATEVPPHTTAIPDFWFEGNAFRVAERYLGLSQTGAQS